MLKWKIPEIGDIEEIQCIVGRTGAKGSDVSAVNIFLLREKYNIRIAIEEGFLFRSYTGNRLPGRNGIAFPLGDGDIEGAVERLENDRKERGHSVKYIFLTEEQKEWLAGYHRMEQEAFATDEGNTDYLYTAEHLALLSGKKNHKKKNRVLHFKRLYPEYELSFVCPENFHMLTKDIIAVEEEWFALQEERIDSSFVERLEIYDACKFFDKLGLFGAVMYIDEMPAAMTLASEISPGNFDIHFEKCYGEYADAGGFAMINQAFAEYLYEEYNAEWINREEDIGLPGLRRAKLSYHPDLMLGKYHSVIC